MDGYKTAVNSARAEVSTARESVIGASSYPAGNAKINQIQYSINSLLASLSKSRIVAPFPGTITRQDAKVGETVQIGEALVSLMSLGNMYIEANVSEINIGKVAEGNKVKIELMLRGRERANIDFAFSVFEKFMGSIPPEYVTEQHPKKLGNIISAVIAPKT